jgi:hypothetical protein
LTHLKRLKDKRGHIIGMVTRKIYDKYGFDSPNPISISSSKVNIDDYYSCEEGTEINKILYKRISSICHPDKNLNSCADTNLDFIKLQKLREENDTYEILCMAHHYRIEIYNLDEEELQFFFEKKLYNLKKEIKEITDSAYFPFLIDDKKGIEVYIKTLIECMENIRKIEKENEALRSQNESLRSLWKQ